ncbi:MAG: holo-ACP synthase [Verrucomicrobiota bacterium]|nr:holo-ACP synthase [Verrucomicrobiota bacterium]
MVIAIGCDIIKISRMKKSLEKYGENFLKKVFIDAEINAADKRIDKNQFFASRWAVKESVAKMLGTGIGKKCAWKDIEVCNNKHNKPKVILSGKALNTAKEQGIKEILVTISHEKEYATAFVLGQD